MMKSVMFLFVALLLIVAPLWSQQIETEILQIKMDRLYFPAGDESGLFVGAPCTVICGRDTLYEGVIEFVGPGISVSRSQNGLETLGSNPDCRAILGIVGIDSAATIRLGTDMPLSFFNLEHETLFIRSGDTVLGNLVDSAVMIGNRLDIYLPANIRFADDRRLDAETVAWWVNDLAVYGQSYITRYFFSKLRPVNDGGVEVIDGFTVRLNFHHPLPRASFFLSHPDFVVYNENLRGTGPFIDFSGLRNQAEQKIFRTNSLYRGEVPAIDRLEIKYFDQTFRMKYTSEEGLLDGYIGFGFADVLAGEYQARALGPELVVMTAGFGREVFSQARFPTSLYYRFDYEMSHLYFTSGDIVPVNRWLIYPVADSSLKFDTSRFYPFDIEKGRLLQRSLSLENNRAAFCFDRTSLRDMARYLADIAAREGWQADLSRYDQPTDYDIRVAFFPASDEIMPFALFAAVLEMNDINRIWPANRQLNRPGWEDCDRGSRLKETVNRIKFFRDAEETVVEEGGYFPLFRPYIYAVSGSGVKNMDFDFYGFPDLSRIYKLKSNAHKNDGNTKP